MPSVVELAQQYHDALEAHDAQAAERIVAAYKGITDRLNAEIDALSEKIAAMPEPTIAKVKRLERYKSLLEQAQTEMERFESYMEVELGQQGAAMVARGLAESEALMTAAVRGEPAVVASFNRLPAEAVTRMLGFLDPNGPLYARLRLLPGFQVDAVEQTILKHVAMGRNPRVLAAALTDAFGMGLTDALRMSRTVQIWSYRESTRANYSANSDVVVGWQWAATLGSDRTCLSCLAMHGSVHPLNEPLRDHHAGRCSAIPITILDGDVKPIAQNGKEYFDALPEAEQRKIMGNKLYDGYKSGKFDFTDVPKEYDDEVYGVMLREKSMAELLGEVKEK